MNCPRCKSQEISRSRRRHIVDDVKASMGLWPFQCQACEHRFTAARRYAPAQSAPVVEQIRPKPGPEMAFRCAPTKPVAQVVIEADDQVQLDQILLALHRAVSMYQSPVVQRGHVHS